MKRTRISRRNFIYRAAGLLLTLWAGRGLAQEKWDDDMQLDITFEVVGKPGLNYRRPYIAVWIENSQGMSVRNLILWFDQERGRRWLNELKRWDRRNHLYDATTGPTRMPGRFSFNWDGKDDKGKLQTQGEYYVCVELVRERGPYELFREKLTLEQASFTRSFTPGEELKEVKLAYGRSG